MSIIGTIITADSDAGLIASEVDHGSGSSFPVAAGRFIFPSFHRLDN
jgi:hypothetical protein